MDAIVFVPGFAGSKLILAGTEVWPPTFWEYFLGYHRLAELQDPNTTSNGIIETVYCFPVYSQIDSDLTTIATALGATKVLFDFDWRKDIWKVTAPLLAQTIDGLYSNGTRSIALVCHSIGGLIGRLLLESPAYAAAPWRSSITEFIGVCNPHHGAPLIVAEAVGVFGFQGISAADMPGLAANPKYPGGYQALPERGFGRVMGQPGNIPIDIYKTAVNGFFGPHSHNVKAAKASYKQLKMSRRPTTVQYDLFAGTGHSTPQWVDVTGPNFSSRSDDLGDGTVPQWSADPYPGTLPALVIPGDHIGVMSTQTFRDNLFQILTGGTLVPAPLAAAPVVVVSLNKQVYAPGEEMSVLIIPDHPSRNIDGVLRVSRAVDPFQKFERYGEDLKINFAGAETTYLSMRLTAPSDPGAYRMTFEEGNYVSTDASSAAFAVSPGATSIYAPPRK